MHIFDNKLVDSE